MAKLVRDKIKQLIKSKGKKPVGYFVKGAQYQKRLTDKLVEEAKEFQKDKSKEELADVLEVITAIYEAFGFDKMEIDALQAKKREKRGAFKTGYVLVEVQENKPK